MKTEIRHCRECHAYFIEGVDTSDCTWRDWFDPAEAQDLLNEMAADLRKKHRYSADAHSQAEYLDTIAKWIESVIERGAAW
jgi:NMD protein affecting ribosome stability and mRNA decay